MCSWNRRKRTWPPLLGITATGKVQGLFSLVETNLENFHLTLLLWSHVCVNRDQKVQRPGWVPGGGRRSVSMGIYYFTHTCHLSQNIWEALGKAETFHIPGNIGKSPWCWQSLPASSGELPQLASSFRHRNRSRCLKTHPGVGSGTAAIEGWVPWQMRVCQETVTSVKGDGL